MTNVFFHKIFCRNFKMLYIERKTVTPVRERVTECLSRGQSGSDPTFLLNIYG